MYYEDRGDLLPATEVLKPSTIRALKVPDDQIDPLLDLSFTLPPGITEEAFKALEQEAKQQSEGGRPYALGIYFDAMHAGYTVGRWVLANRYEAQPLEVLLTKPRSMMLYDLIPLLSWRPAHVAKRIVEWGNETIRPGPAEVSDRELDEMISYGWLFGLGVSAVLHDGEPQRA
jgi:hypothetical protein